MVETHRIGSAADGFGLTETSPARAALDRLMEHQARQGAEAQQISGWLKAWWQVRRQGSFDVTGLWQLDPAVQADLLTVLALVARCSGIEAPGDEKGLDGIAALAELWRD